MKFSPTMLAIHDQKQLFVDDLLIETVHEITRTFHRPVISNGTRLIINAKVEPGGNVDVEIVDGADETISGCSRDACDSFTGDSIRHEVTWRGQNQVPLAAGNPFRKLRFYMHKASLYSFQLIDPEQPQHDVKYPSTGWGVG